MTNFYDSTRPELIPAKADAVLYYDGDYAATAQQAKHLGKVRWNTVFGTAAAAAHAGAADFEPGNPVFEVTGALHEWVLARKAMGCRARVYCSRDNLTLAMAASNDEPNVVYWVATLDNKPWTEAEMLEDLLTLGITLAKGRLWGVQFAGGLKADFDESVLFLDW